MVLDLLGELRDEGVGLAIERGAHPFQDLVGVLGPGLDHVLHVLQAVRGPVQHLVCLIGSTRLLQLLLHLLDRVLDGLVVYLLVVLDVLLRVLLYALRAQRHRALLVQADVRQRVLRVEETVEPLVSLLLMALLRLGVFLLVTLFVALFGLVRRLVILVILVISSLPVVLFELVFALLRLFLHVLLRVAARHQFRLLRALHVHGRLVFLTGEVRLVLILVSRVV